MRRVIAIAAILISMGGTAFAADAGKITVTPVVRTGKTVIGQEIVVPKDPDVVVTIGTMPPGSRLPVHKHPYPHYAYVLEGVLTVTNVETGKSFTIRKGDFLVEMNDTWHYGANNGKEPVKLLIIDHLPKGVASNIVLKK